MIRFPAGYGNGDRIKRYVDYYQASYGVMMLATGQASLFGEGTPAGNLLGNEPSGFAVDFVSAPTDLLVRDASTTLNYSGLPFVADGGKLTFARNSTATRITAAGLLETVAIDVPRIDHTLAGVPRGLLMEEARTNYLLYSDDLTQTNWTKTNVTAAKTATGPDGAANSATTLTASAANGHAQQTITLASGTRVGSFWVKRRTGTGGVFFSQGNTTGTELVTNGTFDTSTTGWTVGASLSATISSGVVTLTRNSASTEGMTQTVTLTSGKRYKFVYTATAGTTNPRVILTNTSPAIDRISTGTQTVYFVATGASTLITLRPQTTTIGASASFDNVSIQEVVETTATVTSSWTRVNADSATITDPSVAIRIATNGDAIDVYGIQLENGASVTSTISTTTTTVTRQADSCSVAVTVFPYSATEGSAVIDMTPSSVAAIAYGLELDDGRTNERVTLGIDTTPNGTYTVVDGGTPQAALVSGAPTANTGIKLASRWKANDFALSVAGGAAVVYTSGTLPTMTTLRIGSAPSSALCLNGWVRQITVLPRTLTNVELQEKTAH